MLSFLLIWSIILPVCLLIGLLILNLCHGSQFSAAGDRFIVSIWLGIVILCVCCLAIALAFPLTPRVGGILALGWVFLACLSSKTRQDFYQLLTLLSLKNFGQGLILALAVAAFTTQQIIWFDTGAYHLGSIHWMAEFGSVFGTALINSKFGFTSSWFAFSAPLIVDWFGGKIGAISNGYLALITCFHLLVIFPKNKETQVTIANGFAAIFFMSIIVIYILDNVNGNSLISFSNDIPVSLLIGIIAWSILIITSGSSLPTKQFTLDSNLIPLILAAGAVSIKLTSLPILAMVLLFYFWRNELTLKRYIVAVALIFILLIPNALFSIKTSGCPLYPSRIMCLHLPWTVNKKTIKGEVDAIRGTSNMPANNNFIVGLMQERFNWFKSSKKIQVTVFLYLLSLLLGIVIFRQKKVPLKPTQNWLVCSGIVGTTFIMAVVPLIRFGMGYFLLIPCLFSANYCYFQQAQRRGLILKKFDKSIGSFSLPILIAILLLSGGKNLQSRLLFPPELPQSKLIKARNNDIEYTYPADFYLRCWAAQLPCSALPIKHSIQLRDNEKGIEAGFEFE